MQVTKLSLDLDLVGSESTGPKYTLVLNQTSVDGDASTDKVNFLHDVLGKLVATFPNGAIEVIIPPGQSHQNTTRIIRGAVDFVKRDANDSPEFGTQPRR